MPEDRPLDDSAPSDAPPDELSQADLMSLHVDQLGAPGTPMAGSWSGAVIGKQKTDPLIGTTLHDTYVVSRVLGEGGMGRVYEVRHTRITSKRYALKVLREQYAQDPDVRRRFQREAEAAAAIEHRGVVGTYDVGETPEGWPYIVCEYLAGLDLYDYLKEHGALPPLWVVHIGRQLTSALQAAHSRGVIHRDLKPHNVFVLEDDSPPERTQPRSDAELPSVKILDFGLSRFVEKDNELTRAGVILGTPGYMAPEQANGRLTDLRTDIYGIGALLYAAATGRAPFQEETPQQTVIAVMSQDAPRPRSLAPNIPVALEVIIQKAMSRDPRERYQTANEMGEALTTLYASSAPLSRRNHAPGAIAGFFALPPRVSLLAHATTALVLGALSVLGAVLASLELKGVDYGNFHPRLLEWLLLGLLSLFFCLAAVLTVRAIARRVWHNSARVAALVPRLRGPLVAATLAYGLSAILVRSFSVVSGVRVGSLTHSELTSNLLLYVVYPMVGALAASAVALRDASNAARSGLVRALGRVGYPAGALVASVLLVANVLFWNPTSSASGQQVVQALGSEAPETAPNAQPTKPQAIARVPEPEPSLPVAPPPEPEETAPETPSELRKPPAPSAPKEELAVAMEEGPAALEELAKRFPEDTAVLKSLVLAYASRAETLDRSVGTIGRLLEVDPSSKEDPDILFILKKGLRSKTRAFSVAATTVKAQMGPDGDGAELLYELMNEFPDQRRRLKGLFQELRQEKKASPAVLVAYDLRYATSCRARLQFLERAEQHGDVRSLRQLQALSTAPKRCGWGRTCYPPCRAEAAQFRKSAEVISERLAHAAP